MNAKATLLMLVLVPIALSAHPLSANDDKKKNSTPPPPSARPQNSTAPRATSKAPNASAKAPSNRPGTTAGAIHPQTARAPATSHPPSARSQNSAAPRAASKAPNASAKAPSNRSGTTAGAIHPQTARAPAPASQRPVNRAQLQQRMSVHPSQQDRVHAHESYKIERAHFTRHMDPIRFAPEHRLILTRMHVVPGTYYYRRSAFYDTYGWVNPPYVYRMYPRYGLWDATFLAFALHHLAEEQYAMMFYNHWADPEMQRWVRDTNGFAAHDAELRAQVDAMNDRVSRLESSGTARDASYVPADAQDVALSPDAVDQLTSK